MLILFLSWNPYRWLAFFPTSFGRTRFLFTCSTIFVKKDKSDRLVVDYLPLNEKTIKNTYPLPRLNELFYQLAGAVVFAKMDLRSGYHQIKSAKRMYPKQPSNSLWPLRYTVFSFGLSNAPATSSRLMLHFHGVSG